MKDIDKTEKHRSESGMFRFRLEALTILIPPKRVALKLFKSRMAKSYNKNL